MPLVHLSARRLASRALGAARLLARATTEAERVAAERYLDILAGQGAMAEQLFIPAPPGVRMSNDGLLMLGNTIHVPGLLAIGLLQSVGFEGQGRAFEDGKEGWYLWMVGPQAKLLEARLVFAAAVFFVWAQREVDRNLQVSEHRDQMMLGVVIGVLGHFGQEAKKAEEKRAIILWAPPYENPSPRAQSVPVAPGEVDPDVGTLKEPEATKVLKEVAADRESFQDWIDAGVMIGQVLGKLRTKPKKRWTDDPLMGITLQMRDLFRESFREPAMPRSTIRVTRRWF